MRSSNTKLTRYAIGVIDINHRGNKVTTSVGNVQQDLLTSYSEKIYEFDVGYIPYGYEHRPDRISELFYGSPGYWWLLMLVNNVPDPFEGFNIGDRILLPKL